MVRWRFKYRKRLCRGRIPRLPTVTDIGNASTNIQHQTSNPFPRESVAALPYTEVLHIKPAHRAERGVRRRPEAPAPRKCRQLCKYGSHGRLGGGRRWMPREAKCESQMVDHSQAVTFLREGVAALPYTEVFVHRISASSGARWPPEARGGYSVEPNAYTSIMNHPHQRGRTHLLAAPPSFQSLTYLLQRYVRRQYTHDNVRHVQSTRGHFENPTRKQPHE